MQEKEEETMIPITKGCRDKLKNYYEHGDDNYSTVLERLMESYDKQHKGR